MRAILEDHFYFCGVWEKFIASDFEQLKKDFAIPVPPIVQSAVLGYVKQKVKRQCLAQGTGK